MAVSYPIMTGVSLPGHLPSATWLRSPVTSGDSRVRLIRLTLPPLLSVKHAPPAATRYDA